MSSDAALPEPDTAAGGPAATGRMLERYVTDLFAQEDEHLVRIRRAMEDAGLPTIQLPAATGRVLQILLRMISARRVLEVGTLAGYSAVWIARALPDDLDGTDGGVLTLEIDPDRAELARGLLADAGVGDRVEVREGDAETLMAAIGPAGSFDAVFLDADKERLPGYVQQARRLLRAGGLLAVDNALWRGQVADPDADDESTRAIRRSHALIAGDPAFDATILPVGDGLLVAIRRA